MRSLSARRWSCRPSQRPSAAGFLAVSLAFAVLGLPTAATGPAPHFAPHSAQLVATSEAIRTGLEGLPATSRIAGSAVTMPCSGIEAGSPGCSATSPPSYGLGAGRIGPEAWTNLTPYLPISPPPRTSAMMTYDPVDGFVLLFGGVLDTGLVDTWTFARGRWTQLIPETSPPPLYDGGMAWDAKDGYAVLFGGISTAGSIYGYPTFEIVNQTWKFSHGTWTNLTGTTGSTPTARYAPLISYDSTDGNVVMYGGWSGTSVPFSDTWTFSDGRWTKLTPHPWPPARGGGEVTDDPTDNGSLLYGGTVLGSYDTTTWIYHNLTWTSHALRPRPAGWDYRLLAYSPSWGEDILFQGGLWGASGPPPATWTFSNLTWSNLTRTTLREPRATLGGELAFDGSDNYGLLVSAYYTPTQGYVPLTWVLGPSLLGELRVDRSVDVGQTARLNATPYSSVGNVSFDYTGLPPGCASMNVPVLNCTPSQAGVFRVSARVTDSSGSLILETANLSVQPDPSVSSFNATPRSITLGASTRLTVAAEGGTGAFSYAYSGLPPGCRTLNESDWTCTPTAASEGSFSVRTAVSDSAGFTTSAATVLTVNPVPTPVALSISPSKLDVGQSFVASVTIRGGTAPFTYAYHDLPAGCISPNATVVTCTADAVGAQLIEVNVTDAFGWTVSAASFVEVSPPPRILDAMATPSIVDVGVPIAFDSTAGGGTGILSYRYDGAPPGCALGNRPSDTCTAALAGDYSIRVSVTDQAGASATASVHLVVHAPISMDAVSATRSEIDEGQNLTISTTTSFGTPPVRFLYSGLPEGCSASEFYPTVECAPVQPGSYVVTVIAADPFQESVQASVGFLVHPAPTIQSIVSNSYSTSPPWVTELSVVVVGGSAVYSFSYAGLPAGCPSADTGTLYCTSDAAGIYPIEVNVTDSVGGSITASFSLSVGSAAPHGPMLPLLTPTDWFVFGLLSVALVVSYLLLRHRPRSRDDRG